MGNKNSRVVPEMEITCSICLEEKKGITHPNCDHSLCIECFKRCYYGDESGAPDFPYPKLEDKYDNGTVQQQKKMEKKYPLIKKYNDEYNQWLDNKDNKYENEENLRSCPLCRK